MLVSKNSQTSAGLVNLGFVLIKPNICIDLFPFRLDVWVECLVKSSLVLQLLLDGPNIIPFVSEKGFQLHVEQVGFEFGLLIHLLVHFPNES